MDMKEAAEIIRAATIGEVIRALAVAAPKLVLNHVDDSGDISVYDRDGIRWLEADEEELFAVAARLKGRKVKECE